MSKKRAKGKKPKPEKNIPRSGLGKFLHKKDIEISAQRYLIDAMSYMALGLFATLITGVIFRTMGDLLHIEFFSKTLAPTASSLSGAGIAVAVAMGLKAPPLVIFASVVCGTIGNTLGGPVGAFIAAMVGTEFGKMVSKETPLDIVITPGVTMIAGGLAGALAGPPIDNAMRWIGELVMRATALQPVPMGIIVAALMGILLTLPTSSVAIWLMINVTGIATGASVVGCCCHTVGFGVQSFRENGWKGLFAQGLGTSMIQIGNIIRKPILLLPPTLAAMILGPLATAVFPIEATVSTAAMGTAGLVSPLGVLSRMTEMEVPAQEIWLKIILFCFVAPCILTLVFSELFRKWGWIKPGDLKLDL